MLPKQVKTFDEYSDAVFLPWTERALRNSNRVNIVWDVYRPNSLKEFTREKRGKGVRKKVSGPTKCPDAIPFLENMSTLLQVNIFHSVLIFIIHDSPCRCRCGL